MEQKSLMTKVKNFIIRTEDEQAALEYSSSIEDYLSLTDEEFQSKKIMIETKLDVEKVKITLFISVILVAFLAGFTEKMFAFLNLISSKILTASADNASVFDGIFWLSIILYLIILLVVIFTILAFLKKYMNLVREEKIINQAKIMREEGE